MHHHNTTVGIKDGRGIHVKLRMVLLDKPALSMAAHWKFMGRASGSGASMRSRAASYAEVRIATCIAVARRQRMISIPLSRGDRSIVRQSPKINMGGL
jgi:hypothetical protein